MINKKRRQFKTFQKKKITHFIKTPEKCILVYGGYGLRAIENGILTKKQIEAARRTITRYLKKVSKLWIRSRVNVSVTAKSLGLRMGKGKGAITQKVRKVYKGEILFEVSCFKTSLVKLVFKKASKKLPIQTQFIWKGR